MKGTVGTQGRPPKDVPLGHADYFSQDQPRARRLRLWLPTPHCIKRIQVEDLLQEGSRHLRDYIVMWTRQAGVWRSVKTPLCAPSFFLGGSANICLPNIGSFHIPANRSPCPLKSQALTLSQFRMTYILHSLVGLWNTYLWLPHKYVISN